MNFTHKSHKYRIQLEGGQATLYKARSRKPLSVFKVEPADNVVEQARVFLNEPSYYDTVNERLTAKGMTKKDFGKVMELTPSALWYKKQYGYTKSEVTFIDDYFNSCLVVVPDTFYRDFIKVCNKEQITKRTIAEDMGICYTSVYDKTNNETFTKQEKYYLTKTYLQNGK